MKFSEMRYTRPDVQDVKNKMADLTKRLEAAKDYAAAQAIFLEKEELICLQKGRIIITEAGYLKMKQQVAYHISGEV